MEIGVLPKQKYEDWRFGRVDYLEWVCTVNLRKISFIMHQMRGYATHFVDTKWIAALKEQPYMEYSD